MADEALFRGRSSAESDVIHAVWEEIGGELVEEFVVPIIPGQLSRARHIDGVFAVDGPRRWHPARTSLALRGRDIAVCQAKAGQLDLGVLGQTLFAAELIQREHAPRSMRLIAAAVQPNPSIEHLLESYRPFGRHIEHRTYPHLKPGRSSGATAPAVMRQALVSVLHSEAGGLLIAAGSRRGRADFANVRAAASGEPLRRTEPDAIILPARQHGQAPATTATEVAAGEPVILAYTCTDLYMTAMGRAVFGGQIARRLLGLADVTSVLRYDTDNAALRALIEQLPHIVLPTYRQSAAAQARSQVATKGKQDSLICASPQVKTAIFQSPISAAFHASPPAAVIALCDPPPMVGARTPASLLWPGGR